MKRLKDHKCLGTKKYKVDEDEGVDGWVYEWKTFGQIYHEVQVLANVIDQKKLFSEVQDEERGLTLKVLGICSINREEWIVTDLAANLLEVTTVPLYETLGKDMLNLILQQTEMQVLFGSEKSLTNILSLANLEEKKYLNTVVCFDYPKSSRLEELCREHDVKLLKFHDEVNY